MKRKPTKFTALSMVVALLTMLGSGMLSPTPAVCQDEGEEVEECTADGITLEDGWLCLHKLECETLKAEELCFRVGPPPS